MVNKLFTKYDDFVNEKYQKGDNSKNIYRSNYLTLTVMPNGLKLELTKAGFDEISEMSEADINTDQFYDLFEEISTNSPFDYHENLGESGLAMSESPGFTFEYSINDDGEYEENEDSEIYYYNNYTIESFMEKLKDTGEVYFVRA